MPNRSKGLTRRFTARTTDEEDTMIKNTQRAYAESGVKISENDALRAALRIGAALLSPDPDTVRTRLLAHVDECRHCTPKELGCPEGKTLWAAQARAQTPPRAHRGPRAVPDAPTAPQTPTATLAGFGLARGA